MSDSDLTLILIPVALAFAATAFALLRRSRIRRWHRQLGAPTSPGGEKLFDQFYREHRARIPIPADSFVLTLATAQVRQAQVALPPPVRARMAVPAELTTEDKIKSFLGASSDAGALVPTDTLAENALINLVNVLRGKKQLGLGLEHALLDSLGAAGGLAGSKVGGVVGLISVSWLAGLALPFVALLVPASVLIGGAIGALAGKRAGGWFKGWRYLIAIQRLRGVCREFQKWFIAQFPHFIQTRQAEFKRAIALTQNQRRKHQGRLMRWLMPDLKTVFLTQCLVRLEQDRKKENQRLESLRDQMKRLDPLRLVALLEELSRQAGQLSPEAQRENPELWAHARAYAAAATLLRQMQVPPDKRRETDRQSA